MGDVSRTLGLDLGTNSIGWALIDHDNNGIAAGIHASGVRIFQEAVDEKTRIPKSQQRRSARALRRILARRRRRKAKLEKILIVVGLLPASLSGGDGREQQLNDIGDVYDLRKRALDERLEPYQIGRVLKHLCARRGFQSNRKSALGVLAQEFDDFLVAADEIADGDEAADEDARKRRKEATDEEGKVKSAISALRSRIADAKARTLGEYLASIPATDRKRGLYTDRQMFKDEFRAVWERQAAFHPNLLTEHLEAAVSEAIFMQRPLKSSRGFVGRCSLEPSRRRAQVARLECQRFRILQEINHLEVRNPSTGRYRDLDMPEREKLKLKLSQQKTLSWGEARKLLGLHKSERFNLEEAGRERLKGDITVCSLRKILGPAWQEFSADRRVNLVEDILTISDKGHLVRRLREHWNFDRRTQFELAMLELEPGYMSHSLLAIRKMLPFLESGAKYHEARAAAGYGFEKPAPTALNQLPEPPSVRNPVVQKALFEVRRVVNTIVRTFGKPDVIRVEMARDLKLTGKRKEAFEKQQRLNEKANQRARTQLEENGLPQPSRDDLIKFRLWEECGGECPYTGRAISMHQLFGGEVDIEHIVPYARCLDDSYMNKTLCFADENRSTKRGQTPWEAYGADAAKWEQIVQRAKKSGIPVAKQRRLMMRELPAVDDFISRQLNDTRYITVEVKSYLARLGTTVEVTKGGITADLRRVWGVNKILGFDEDKKVRTDHRHHALDAVIIALCDRSRYRRLATASGAAGDRSLMHGRLTLPEPWHDFQSTVSEALEKIVVSHAVNRRIVGALHEATAYGFHAATGKYHYRKRLDALFSAKGVENIADPVIQRLVKERLDAHGGNSKAAFHTPLFHLDGKTPIRSVRLARNASADSLTGVAVNGSDPFKYYELGSNHHIEIFTDPVTGKRSGRVVSTIEAARRSRSLKASLVDRESPPLEFVMSLCINDSVEIEGGQRFRVQKVSKSTQITLRENRAATIDNNAERKLVMPSTLKGRKIDVDAIGRVSDARD
jgi:CRISPR-associated endonuclease Csn1